MRRDALPRREFRATSLRIGLQTGVLVLGVLVVVGAVFWGLYRHAVTGAENSLLSSTAREVDRPQEAPPGVWVTIQQKGRTESSSGLPSPLPDDEALADVERHGGSMVSHLNGPDGGYLVRTQRVGDRITQAAISLHDRDEEASRVATSILLAALVGVLLSGGVAAWLASRAVRPMAESLVRQRRFVADASHELRTPLTHLSTRVQLLNRRASRGPIGPDDLAPIVEDTHVLAGILEELLAASDTREQLRNPVDLGGLVTEVAAAARPYADEHGIELVTTVWGSSVASIVPFAVRRAVIALIDNAVDHAESRVDVDVALMRRHIQITVTDDGPGIAKDLVPHVFERFSGSRTSDPTGRRHFGIGLALVADVAAAHGGSVDVQPRADGMSGTTFTLTVRVNRRRGGVD